MNAVKKAVFGVMAGAVVVATTLGSSLLRPVQGPEEIPDGPLTIRQDEAHGVSLTVEPLAANDAAVGTQRVTATVQPEGAICDLEWSLSVGNSEIDEASISDYLTITAVSSTAIDINCHQRFEGFAQLTVSDSFSSISATASVSAWTVYGISNKIAINTNSDFSINNTGSTSWTLPTSSSTSYTKQSILYDWYLYSATNLSNGRVTATDIEDGLSLTYNGALASGDTVALVKDVPYISQSGGRTPYIMSGDEVWVIAEVSRRPNYVFYRADSESNWFSDSTLLESWYQNGIYVGHIQINTGSNAWEGVIGIAYNHDGSSGFRPFTVTVKSIEMYCV